MAKIAKTADRKKVMDTSKSTACPKCGKDTRIVKRTKDRERGVPGGIYIPCSACDFYESYRVAVGYWLLASSHVGKARIDRAFFFWSQGELSGETLGLNSTESELKAKSQKLMAKG